MSNIEQAIAVLEEHIVVIQTVPEWAERMGFDSPRYFSRKIRDAHGKRPKEIIVEKKLQKIKACLAQTKDEILFCTARDLGFANDNALYKFVKRHTGKSPTELKRECEKGV